MRTWITDPSAGRLQDLVKLLCNSPGGVSTATLVTRVFLADMRYYRIFPRQMTSLTYIVGCGEIICWPHLDHLERTRLDFSNICSNLHNRQNHLEGYRLLELKERLDTTVGIEIDRFCWTRYQDEMEETDALVGSLMQLSTLAEE